MNIFYKEYVGDELLSPIISRDKMKACYSMQEIDLRFYIDHLTPEKIRVFEEIDENSFHTDFYGLIFKHREKQ